MINQISPCSSQPNVNPGLILSQVHELLTEEHQPREIYYLSEKNYRRMPVRDPNGCYVVYGSDGESQDIYYGDYHATCRFPEDPGAFEYYLSYDPIRREYPIYVNYQGDMLELNRYDTMEKAARAVRLYNCAGSHGQVAMKIYNTLLSYCSGFISANHMVLSVVSLYNETFQSQFQALLDAIHISQDVLKDDMNLDTIPTRVLDHMNLLSQQNTMLTKNPMYNLYWEITKWLVGNQYLKDQKAQLVKHQYPDFHKECQQLQKLSQLTVYYRT